MTWLRYFLFVSAIIIAIKSEFINVDSQQSQTPFPTIRNKGQKDTYKYVLNVGTNNIEDQIKKIQSVQHSTVNQIQKWKNRTKLVSFDNTMQAYPQFKQKIKADKLIKFVKYSLCFFGSLPPYRIAILDNKFYLYGKNLTLHHAAIVRQAFNRVLNRTKLPDLYFLLFIEDNIPFQQITKDKLNCAQIPMFMFNKNVESYMEINKFLFPDIYVLSQWGAKINQAKAASIQFPWQKKLPMIFFVGGETGHGPYITRQTDFKKYYHRGAAVQMSLKYPDIIYARLTANRTDLSRQIFQRSGNNLQIFTKRKTIARHVNFRYIASFDGYASAWSRPGYILFSNSVLFKTDSPNMQWYYDKLIPGVNFIQIKDDFSNILSMRRKLEKHPSKAKQIAKKANQLAQKYLTVTAIDDYIIEVLNKYAAIQRLQLTTQEKAKVHNGYDVQNLLAKKYL